MNNIDTIVNLIQINLISMELLKVNMDRIEDKTSDDYLNLAAVMHSMKIQNEFFAEEGLKVAAQMGLAAI